MVWITFYRKINFKLKAGTLLYTVVISFLIALTSSFIILYGYLSNLRLLQNELQNRVIRNAESGFAILMSKNDFIPRDQIVPLDLFKNGIDSVGLLKKTWGCYDVVSSTAFFKNFSFAKTALLGSRETNPNEVLYLCDMDKPLSVSGSTIIKGDCYLPKSGIKRAYIEGQNFKGDKLVDGIIRQSEKDLPHIDSVLILDLKARLKGEYNDKDTIVYYESLFDRDSIVNSFSNKTMIVYEDNVLVISDKSFKGNIIFYSPRQIVVSSSASISDVVLFSSSIVFEQNFSGTLQAFASDSIIINESCKLNFPSAIGLVNRYDPKKRFRGIKIKKGALVYGNVFALGSEKESEFVKIDIEKEAVIKGTVYSNGYIDMKGFVYGRVLSKGFILNTPSSVYQNHLLNATLNIEKLTQYYVSALLMDDNTNREIAKWLR